MLISDHEFLFFVSFVCVCVCSLKLFFFSSRERAAASGGNVGAGQHREVWSNKGSSYADLYTQNVVINMDDQEDQQKQANEGKAPKERPVWLTQSTVQGAYSEPDALKNRKFIRPLLRAPDHFLLNL